MIRRFVLRSFYFFLTLFFSAFFNFGTSSGSRTHSGSRAHLLLIEPAIVLLKSSLLSQNCGAPRRLIMDAETSGLEILTEKDSSSLLSRNPLSKEELLFAQYNLQRSGILRCVNSADFSQ